MESPLINRRDFLRTSATAGLLSLLPKSGVFAETSDSFKKPNVLFLFTDQHHAGMMGCAGASQVQSPHLDRLASEGVRFERAYCPTGVCVASRNAMMTGQASRTTGLVTGAKVGAVDSILQRYAPLQRMFRQAGYYTFTAGKRHLQSPVDTDWDYTAGHLNDQEESRDTVNYWKWIESQGLLKELQKDFSAEWGKRFGGDTATVPLTCRLSSLPSEATMEAFTTQQTVEFLKSPTAKKQPFFAWSTFYRPHQPYTPLAEYADRVDLESIQLPRSFGQNPDELPPVLRYYRTKKGGGPWSLASFDESDFRRYLAYYRALIQEIDMHIGTILTTLEQEGLAENTIIIYASDHGDFIGNHGLAEKLAMGHNFYEETLRVPLIFRYPGKISSGIVSQDLAGLLDIYPTLMALCGLEAPKGTSLAGASLVDMLTRQTPLGRDYIVSENLSQMSVITADWKYGKWLASPKKPNFYGDYRSFGDMLMNRENDPDEVVNVYTDSEYGDHRKELEAHAKDWAERTDDVGKRAYFASLGAEYPAA